MEFITRFILKPNAGAPAPEATDLPERARKARTIWIGAKDRVDAELGKLQQVLREIDDANCQVIADKGLNGFTGKLQTGLLAALMDAEAAGPDVASDRQVALIDAIEDFEDRLANDPAISLIEDIGAMKEVMAPVALTKTLGAALGRMHSLVAG